jgi:Uncharacterized protein, possibly involved in aromatic compounds catabolism
MRVDAGRARVSMPSGPWLRGLDGRPAAGGLGVLMDDVLGQALLTFRPEGHWPVTTELALDFAAPLPTDGTSLLAEAWPVSTDAGGGLAQGRVVDAVGRTIAVGTTWARLLPGVPDTVLNPPQVPAVTERGSCLPVLLGVEFEPDGRLTAPELPDLRNPRGVMHGGIVACLAELASQAPSTPELATASLHVTYIRPAVGVITFEPQIIHRGRSLALTHVIARNEAGAPCAVATVTRRSAESQAQTTH